MRANAKEAIGGFLKRVGWPRILLAALVICLPVCFAFPAIQADPDAPEEADNRDIPITMALWGFKDPSVNENARVVSDYISERFGISIEPYTIDMNNWQQRIDIMVASNRIPDVFVYDVHGRKAGFNRLITSRRIRSVPEELYAAHENLNRLLIDRRETQAYRDGEMYHIPRPVAAGDANAGNRYALFYRKDYANALGADFSNGVSWGELGEFFLAAAQGDPDGNGKSNTAGFTVLSGGQEILFDTLYENYGVREWVYEDGQWIPGLLSARCRELTWWLKGLYELGGIDQDFFCVTAKASSEKFATGKVAALLAPADFYSAADGFRLKYWNVLNPGLPIEDVVDLLPLPAKPGARQYNKPQKDDTATLFSSAVDNEKLERLLALMEFLYTEDGSVLLRYGVEGVHYQAEEGRIRSLVTDMHGNTILFSETCPDFSSLQYLSTWRRDGLSRYEEAGYIAWDRYMDERLKELYWANNSPPLWTDNLSGEAVSALSIRGYAADHLSALIAEPKNYSRDWEEYVAGAMADPAVRDAIREVNSAARHLGVNPADYGF